MSQNPSPLPAVFAAVLALAVASGALAQDAPLSTALTPPPPAATSETPLSPPPAPTAPSPPPELAPSPPPAAPAPVFAAPAPVEAAPLSAPDLFAADAGKPTGLPSDLWSGASLDLARTVIPMAVTRPMTPAAQAFAIHVMSTAASAPDGGGADADLAAARIYVVLSLGDPIGARAMLQHTPGVRQSAALSQVAAEADLVLGRDDEACSLGDTLAVGKDSAYFRRLRVYCLLKGGDKPGAQLAYDLTSEQAKDDVYKHLMSAAVSGQTAGVQPSLRNGLEYALSRLMGLDPTPVMDKAWAPVATMLALNATEPAPLQAAAAAMMAKRQIDLNRAASLNPAVMAAVQSLANDKLDPTLAERLAAGGVAGSAEEQQGLALYAAAGAPGAGRVRAAFAGFDIGAARANQARMLEMDAVSSRGAKGDVALLALWLMMDAGEAGPSVADRARIIRAMDVAGFGQDARRYALEGLLYLKTLPAAPAKAAAPLSKPTKKAPPPKPVHKSRKKAAPSAD